MVLIIFDFVDCCSMRQEMTRPKLEYHPRERKRAMSRGGDNLFDMDW